MGGMPGFFLLPPLRTPLVGVFSGVFPSAVQGQFRFTVLLFTVCSLRIVYVHVYFAPSVLVFTYVYSRFASVWHLGTHYGVYVWFPSSFMGFFYFGCLRQLKVCIG